VRRGGRAPPLKDGLIAPHIADALTKLPKELIAIVAQGTPEAEGVPSNGRKHRRESPRTVT
jgi:hypothetical protein